MKELPKRKSRLLRITTKSEDQIMDQNNGLEAKISKEQTGTLLTIDFGEVPLLLTRIFLQDQTSPLRTINRATEDHMIYAQICHSIEMTGIDPEMDLSTTRTETGETMETFLVPRQLKEVTSHKITPIVNQEVINLATLHFADLTIDQRLVSRLMNKNFRRAIVRHHLMWFASPQPMIPLTNYRMFAR